MKRTVITIFAAAAFTVAAHAQGLQADIPFDFSVSGKRLPAGKYQVVRQTSVNGAVYSIRGTQSKHAYAVASMRLNNDQASDSKIVFRCGTAGCVLAELHHTGHQGAGFSTPANRSGQQERSVAVKLTAAPNAGF